jgi:hypothetical protein
MGDKMSNPYIEANIEFAERLVESLAPRVTNGTGSQLTLTAGEVGALYHIAQNFLFEMQEDEA